MFRGPCLTAPHKHYALDVIKDNAIHLTMKSLFAKYDHIVLLNNEIIIHLIMALCDYFSNNEN